MKRRILTLVACLGLLMASGWLVTNPAWAGSYTISCAGGGSKTCSGSSCIGNDDTNSQRGYCSCSSADGGVDFKQCPVRDLAMIEEGPVN
ncbi:MAG TPA: hypothetical protein VFZ44_02450 [Pyrinomonadaceae bacterium]